MTPKPEDLLARAHRTPAAPNPLADLKYFDGSVQQIERIPADLKKLYKTAFEIVPTWILQCAAVRQKWIDQAQSPRAFRCPEECRGFFAFSFLSTN
jgi:hypothetical protein